LATITNAYSRFVPRQFLALLGKENVLDIRVCARVCIVASYIN
jgi:hypothetical protein